MPSIVASDPLLPCWSLRGRSLPPIVQGGMGIGVSAHRLAGAAAGAGALGPISSAELRHQRPHFLERAQFGVTTRPVAESMRYLLTGALHAH